MASTDLTLTGQTPTNNKILTFSAWVKRSALGYNTIMSWEDTSNSSNNFRIAFRSDDVLQILDYASSTVMDYRTTQVFRDTSAFYNIVVAVDTTNATANDRTKLWVNGESVSSFGTQTTYSLNDSTQGQQSGYDCVIGSINSSYYFNGSMAHVHFIDGTAYDADTFGETDATTGIWKPKTAPSVTYGNNGFFLKFENSGAFGTDSSGNANNFTVNGTMTQTIDTPSNVFATLNALNKQASSFNLSNGNLTGQNTTNAWRGLYATLGFSAGKWYWETKVTNLGGTNYISFGISDAEQMLNADGEPSESSRVYVYKHTGQKKNNAVAESYGDTYTTNDIVQIAFDADNGTIWFGKNGTWQNSATETEIENGTTTNSAYSGLDTTKTWIPVTENNNTGIMNMNFGNGYFGTTAVSSSENPDDGIGIFEYSVPTGYKALCTKSINAQEYD